MKYQTLTDEQAKAYLDGRGAKCPYCGSNDISGGDDDHSQDEVFQTIECEACHRCWVDVYKLSEVDDGEICCTLCGGIFVEGEDVEYTTLKGWQHTACPAKG